MGVRRDGDLAYLGINGVREDRVGRLIFVELQFCTPGTKAGTPAHMGQEGTVESISDGEYTVLVGSLRFRARRDEILLTKSAAPQASSPVAWLPRGVSAEVSVDQNFTPEINVIGATVDDAVDRVDKFLDEAYLAGAETVRVIHGHGKGALRRAISELLTGHAHVERFNVAPANQGGAGATVVELRK